MTDEIATSVRSVELVGVASGRLRGLENINKTMAAVGRPDLAAQGGNG